ncbi:MAG: acyl-CoA synthetase [Candidatus Binatia bacterium]
MIPLIHRATAHDSRTALIAPDATWSYADLLAASGRAAAELLGGGADLGEARVAFLVAPSCAHVATQWGIWRAGGVAVPMCTTHPERELAYVIEDSDAAVVVADAAYAERVEPLARARGRRFVSTHALLAAAAGPLPDVDASRRAMMLYTSGTTSKPKGVVTTHAMLAAQITSLFEAWEWVADDHVLHVLPLHHLHGVMNVLCCAMWAGATCEMQNGFDADAVWDRLAAADGLTLFMAVPTIYTRLRARWEAASPERRRAMREGCQRVRLMVSGSAALPADLAEAWYEISGHRLLERYGMTEIGMALANPLRGERRIGHVGVPVPGIDVRLVDEAGAPVAEATPGQIEVRGPGVFREYWRRPDATREAFTSDGWFKTGDVAVIESGSYRLLGRASVDIIKTGGYKVSALEIEDVLRTHPDIAECAVVGVPDAEWGERVGAAVITQSGGALDLGAVRTWAKERLAPYKVPSLLRVVDTLPRNAMGKVLKPEVAGLFR